MEAVLFLAHDRRPGAMAALTQLAAQAGPTRTVAALFDQTGGAYSLEGLPEAAEPFTCEALTRRLPYAAKHAQHPGTLWPRNLDLPVLGYWAEHPTLERLWLIEYDVRFTGDWAWFFNQFAASPADLLATGVYDQPFRPGWAHWDTLAGPTEIPLASRTRATLSIYRASAAALSALDAGYRAGWSGHYEVSTPTLVKRAGLVIEDMGGDGAYVAAGNHRRFYTNEPGRPGLGQGTFVLHEANRLPADRPDMLWNPFKD